MRVGSSTATDPLTVLRSDLSAEVGLDGCAVVDAGSFIHALERQVVAREVKPIKPPKALMALIGKARGAVSVFISSMCCTVLAFHEQLLATFVWLWVC